METNPESYKKEKDIEDNPISIPTAALKVITDLANKCICKIKCNKKGVGTGFFCAIPFPDKYQRLPVLITNNHVLKLSDIIKGKKINLSISNEKQPFEFEIDNKRKVYTNEAYDITIIEIKNSDNINTDSFLDIDEQVFSTNFPEIYNKKSVYILNYPHGNISEFSSGIIKSFSVDNYSIRHTCQSQSGSSGSPIINLITHKVIGIHKGCPKKNDKYNLGTFIKEPIEDFNKEMKNENLEFDKLFITEYDKEDINDFFNIFKIERNMSNIDQIDENSLFSKMIEKKEECKKKQVEEKIEEISFPNIVVEENYNNNNLIKIILFFKYFYEKKVENINKIIIRLNELSLKVYYPFLEMQSKKIIIPRERGSYLDSINFHGICFSFENYVLNAINYFIFYKGLVSYIRKKINDGIFIFKQNYSQNLNEQQLKKYKSKLIYPLIKISLLNDIFIFIKDNKNINPLNSYDEITNMINTLKGQIINYNYNKISLYEIKCIESCINSVEENVNEICKENDIPDLYDKINQEIDIIDRNMKLLKEEYLSIINNLN